jgi:TRAP-type uncharacterized transport system substrate-binding protein
MRRFIVTATLGVAFGLWVGVAQVGSQTAPKSGEEGAPEDVLKQRVNTWTVGLASGLYDGTYLRFADDLGKALDDGDQLHVLPVVTRGAASNLEDLLYLRGIDMAFLQADVLEYFRSVRKTPHLEDRVRYIIRLPGNEFHVTVGPDIRSLEDLRGKKVIFGPPGNAATRTGPIVFQRLKLPVEPVFTEFAAGYDMVLSGQAAGVLGSMSKPVPYWLKLPQNAGLHLLSVPYSKVFGDIYTIGEFTNADYPNLIPPGERIDTLAAPAVLAVYNWPKNSDRYRRVERFVQYLFNRWDKLIQPPFHPKWRDVNLAATVPGWTRFSVAEEMLQRGPPHSDDQAIARDFETYISRQVRVAPRNEAERDAVFRQFMLWREQQRRQ